jgi:hypothetical protein
MVTLCSTWIDSPPFPDVSLPGIEQKPDDDQGYKGDQDQQKLAFRHRCLLNRARRCRLSVQLSGKFVKAATGGVQEAKVA